MMRHCIFLILLVFAPSAFARTDLSAAINQGLKDQNELRPQKKSKKKAGSVKAPHIAVTLRPKESTPRTGRTVANRDGAYSLRKPNHQETKRADKIQRNVASSKGAKKISLKKQAVASGGEFSKIKKKPKIVKRQKIASNR